MSGPLEFRILGPLEVVSDNGPLALPAGKPRALLAVLLLSAADGGQERAGLHRSAAASAW